MIVCRTIQELKASLSELRTDRKSLGFVPTMGYLHEGHASLLRRAEEENDVTVLSIFVNPLQFGPNEDLDRYPRDEERDLAIAAECGTDIVFLPSVKEMYPKRPLTTVLVSGITSRLCGASRPGHFDGVGTVVSKLFHLVIPTRAYFGMKDAQQVAVIEQMVHDLNFEVEIVRCETVREPDGLALSSRNVYLSAEQREQAVRLSQSLQMAGDWLYAPGMTAGQLKRNIVSHITESELAEIDYAEFLTYPSLEPIDEQTSTATLEEQTIVALAVKFGTTRLIDNRLFDI
ncbi:pantoate--beta-alanine ligase [Paenibacillus sp. LHD-117]|uniref:pantoate--beta-alanine ligase n=1 Tax=Paenibacillus sp. LHD-117 TaxID=3071412 RepID=UPI0027E1319A|nr:pantoate--beta-alanine ligase [Paenibacillus sp. LHD-117]MDQ6418195.1 pantoate--beta-alanine ligase [Paenibacillus sp. LHD-117]